MAYPAAMEPHPSLPPVLWEQTPPEVRAYIGTLEARVAALEDMVHTLTAVVAEPVKEARAYVEEQSVAHLETSWREGGKRAWLWVAVTSLVTAFLIRMSRGGQVVRELLGEHFSGILVTDRYSAYNWYPVRWRQLC